MTINYAKAIIAALALICVTILLMSHSIAPEAGFGLMGTIVGYAVGNGIAAKSQGQYVPLISKKDDGNG